METDDTSRNDDATAPEEGERDVAASDALDKEPDYNPQDEELKDLKGG